MSNGLWSIDHRWSPHNKQSNACQRESCANNTTKSYTRCQYEATVRTLLFVKPKLHRKLLMHLGGRIEAVVREGGLEVLSLLALEPVQRAPLAASRDTDNVSGSTK